MEKIFRLLTQNPAVQTLAKGKGNVVTTHISDEAYLIASAFLAAQKNILVVKSNQYEALQLYRQLIDMNQKDVLFFPVDESQRIEALVQSPELMAERINTLYQLQGDEPKIIIAHTASLIRCLPSASLFKERMLRLQVNQQIEINDLKRALIYNGYQYTTRVDQPFYFAQRGGVIDVYSMQYPNPIRIEFFDDEIESIRFYNADDQRTIESISEIEIIPATDIIYEDDEVEACCEKVLAIKQDCIGKLDTFKQDELDENIAIDLENLRQHDTSFSMYKFLPFLTTINTIKDYCHNPILFLSVYTSILDNYKMYVEELFYYNKELFEEGRSLLNLSLYVDINDVIKGNAVYGEIFKSKEKEVSFNARQIQSIYQSEAQLINELTGYAKISKVLLILKNDMHFRNITELLERHQIAFTLISEQDDIYPGINIIRGELSGGIELVDERLTIITEKELYGTTPETKKNFVKYKNAKVIQNFSELNVGDYIVHDTHGIGQYMGIKTLEVQGVHRDYLYISYRGNDTLYVPVDQFKLIRKYTSANGHAPKVHKLGSAEWQRTKQKIKSKVDDLADELIALYAKRLTQQGFAFDQDNAMQQDFENEFNYQLTPDQQQAVNEIKADMEQPRPMDRLLCGDVGFGKTEVALRAAFKAILSGKQVAFLCPTTILSSQHYRTVTERFKNFPVNFALLNRFTTPKQTKEILNSVKDGSLDLLIGTHKILNNNVQFKDIGLLIVDEEQRFGVRHKEKIKEYKETIDVLTLSATPIPRTLQMSLMGVRSLSQIETAPTNRLPVQTYVMEKNPALIKQVIERELSRQGQVFYLYNRTSSITDVANKIAMTIPGAKVGIGHGQMHKDDLEDVMMKFMNKEYNVLVCTTIIETGIDIPNANTLIVEDADKFGLSQLYQIKGRVGRSDRNAYAYLLYRPNKQMSEEAAKRLKAIKEFTQLGSGYKIAMRDLTIRGAGDILGGQQAGFIDTVGFDMYMKILMEVVDEKRGIEQKEDVPVLNVNVDGYIPSDYVNTDLEKLELYQRLEHVQSLEDLDAIKIELNDIYGKLPKTVETLVQKREFDLIMNDEKIDEMKEEKNLVQIILTQAFSDRLDGEKLFNMISEYRKKVSLTYTMKKIVIKFLKDENWLARANELLPRIKEL
ncbi:MAG: transcription-repair coupling factor [Beduini sp.]|uniref:transcription-repair coupling factor n=1 Tax=Beduini sp. TaxID=1922300 RepID=UPI0039A0A5EF